MSKRGYMASPIRQRLTTEGICAGLMAWVAWDWGSAAFNVVISFVFSPYLAGAVAADETTGSAALGWATAIAGLIIAAIAPAWGQRSDATGGASSRQRRLGALTAVVVLVTAALALVRPHPSFLLLGLVLLAGGQVASQLAEVDHNALLRGVAPAGATGRVSGLGTAALHLGAVVVLLLAYTGLIAPQVGWFGITHAQGAAVRAVAVLCAVWFALFALPIVFVRLPASVPVDPVPVRRASGWIMAYRQLGRDLVQLRRHRPHLLGFLVASALFRDGLAAVFVFFPILAHGSFGLGPADLLILGIAIMAVGAAGAVAGGILDDRLGPKVIIVGSLTGVIVALAMILVIHAQWALWVCALAASAFIGPTMSASRSYLARAAPPQQQGQLFGLYACTGRVVSFVAPAAFALGVSILGGQRWGMLGITVVLLAGLLAVLPVRAVDHAGVRPHTEEVAA
jgi:UMF1 family MFS transporter